MEELTYSAKIAIIKVLEEILKADSIVRDSEIEYMNEVVKSFCLGNDYKEDVNKLMTLQALSIIKELTIDQKGEVAKMMGKMIVIDKDINYNEVMMYNTFCESCNIEKDFNVNEYPGSSLSGPFINPEDMMNKL